MFRLTVSIGIAAATEDCRTWEGLLAYADHAMYRAKNAGKNRTIVHSLQPTFTPSDLRDQLTT